MRKMELLSALAATLFLASCSQKTTPEEISPEDAVGRLSYVALTLESIDPSPTNPDGVPHSLVLERRDLTGQITWSVENIPTPDGYSYASAQLVSVSDGVLAMLATPPLVEGSSA